MRLRRLPSSPRSPPLSPVCDVEDLAFDASRGLKVTSFASADAGPPRPHFARFSFYTRDVQGEVAFDRQPLTMHS